MTMPRMVFTSGVLSCLVAGCDGVVPGSERQIDPKLVSEARSASAECQFPAWMLEKKQSYTTEELDQLNTAARACQAAVSRYLDTHYKGKY